MVPLERSRSSLRCLRPSGGVVSLNPGVLLGSPPRWCVCVSREVGSFGGCLSPSEVTRLLLLRLPLSRFRRVAALNMQYAGSRHPRPWDSPGRSTGVCCHFLLQCVKVKSESEVAQSCLALRDPMDCSLLGSSVHGIFQARVLEWGAIAFSEHTYIYG